MKELGSGTHYELLATSSLYFTKFIEAQQSLAEKLMATDLSILASMDSAEEDSRLLQMLDNVALITVKGGLTNEDNYYNRYYGLVSYNEIRTAAMQALDHGAESIMFHYGTGGGSVSGMNDTAEMISNLEVPTVSYTDSQCCSAGYALASQGDHVYAGAFAEVGSIGVIAKLYDRSKMLADYGIKPERFRSGPLKAVGDGDFKLTDKERDYIQAKVMNFANKFYDLVSAATGMSLAVMHKLDITSGKTYIGEEALKVNLVEDIKTFDESIAKAFDFAKAVDKSSNYAVL